MNILIKDILAVLPDGSKLCSVYVSDGKITGVETAPGGLSIIRPLTKEEINS